VTVPVKDDHQERAVPDVWQPTLSAIVESLVREDVVVAADLSAVDPVSDDLSHACREAVRHYGDVTLVPLPKDTWDTSVCLWQGVRWQCLVDLWTEQEGRSDLVLDIDVRDDGRGYRYSINLVYVP
jgi:hypothetical protein